MPVTKVAQMSSFSLKCTRKRLAVGFCPDPLGSLQCSPDLLAGFKSGSSRQGQGKEEGGKTGWD